MSIIGKTNSAALTHVIREEMPTRGTLRSRDFAQYGVSRQQVKRLLESAKLERLGRGLYRFPETEWTRHHVLAEVALRIPNGIVCLTSALAFHGVTTQLPFHVDMLIGQTARVPHLVSPALRIFRAGAECFKTGVEEHMVEGVAVRVTCLSRAIAECFKYRSRVGFDVALEALSEGLRRDPRTGKPRCTRDDIYHYSKMLRVHNVIRPYLEALSL